MIEHIKTVILSILIVISFILTWQLWTYQPELEFLDEESVEESSQLAEGVDLTDVVRPANVVFHLNNAQRMTSHGSHEFITEMIEDLLSSQWRNVEMLEYPGQERVYENEDDKIEFILPTSLPLQTFDRWFEESESLADQQDNTFTFERVLVADEGGALRVQLVSFDDQQVLEGYVDLDMEMFQDYMGHFAGSDAYDAIQTFVGANENPLQKPVYLPSESVSYPELQFNSINIDEEALIPYLFVDRESVLTPDPESYDGGELYYSSDRQMRVSRFGNYIEYDYPQNEISDDRDYQIIANAYEFVNAHGGFTNQFQLYNWSASGASEHARFRMLVDGLPVLGTNVSWFDYASINVTQQNDIISSYDRPAFMFNEHDPLDEDPTDQLRELPDGETVLNEIEESSRFDISEIEDIRIGYALERVDTYVNVIPHWYVKIDGGWVQLSEEEGDLDGLE